MACFYPLTGWQTRAGEVTIGGRQPADSRHLRIPCGGCLGCRKARAREWALRCTLERAQHQHAAWTTLTYDTTSLPHTLDKRALQLWLKRFRFEATQPIRFFGCGEYGEKRGRPHFHVILFGIDATTADTITRHTWPYGLTATYDLTERMISYTAGYTAKKIDYKDRAIIRRVCQYWQLPLTTSHVDPTTGEYYHQQVVYQPPFLQMSRNPGLGGHARQWPKSWRSYAIHNGTRLPVPRFLHNSYKLQATAEELEELAYEKEQLTLSRDTSNERLKAQEIILKKQLQLARERRQYD